MSENLDTIIETTQRLVARARLRLFWETYAPTLAPGFLAVGVFSLGAWLGLWQWLGDPFRLIALAVTLFFLTRSVLRALPLRLPLFDRCAGAAQPGIARWIRQGNGWSSRQNPRQAEQHPGQ